MNDSKASGHLRFAGVPTGHEPRRPACLAFACLVCRPLRCGDLGVIFACKQHFWVDLFSLAALAMLPNAPALAQQKAGAKLVGPKLTTLSVFTLACAEQGQRYKSVTSPG